jgi:hypothetical protein
MDSMAQSIHGQILDRLAESVSDLYQKLTAERTHRVAIQGEKVYLDNIHLTLLELDNTIIDLRDITIFEEIKQ